jgi:hypothetical protein
VGFPKVIYFNKIKNPNLFQWKIPSFNFDPI